MFPNIDLDLLRAHVCHNENEQNNVTVKHYNFYLAGKRQTKHVTKNQKLLNSQSRCLFLKNV